MNTLARSYTSVFYDLRPAKQVERRMLIDLFQRLLGGGFEIRDYQYTGLGSIYFFDFVLFYKLLGITKLLSVEIDTAITRRVLFNRPYREIAVRFAPIGEVIPELDRDLKHILWLDYDIRLTSSVIEDVYAAAYHLSPGSLLFVTIDAEPPKLGDGPADWENYFKQEAGDFIPFGSDVSDYAQSALPSTNAKVLENVIRSSLSRRPNVSYYPLIGFSYADGHEMVSLGGMLGTAQEKRRLAGCGLKAVSYLRRNLRRPLTRIEVPRLTRRERTYLDEHMPPAAGWRLEAFELEAAAVQSYAEIHRFYPLYGELLA